MGTPLVSDDMCPHLLRSPPTTGIEWRSKLHRSQSEGSCERDPLRLPRLRHRRLVSSSRSSHAGCGHTERRVRGGGRTNGCPEWSMVVFRGQGVAGQPPCDVAAQREEDTCGTASRVFALGRDSDAGRLVDGSFRAGASGHGSRRDAGDCGNDATCVWTTHRGFHDWGRGSEGRGALGAWRASPPGRDRAAIAGGISNCPIAHSGGLSGNRAGVVYRDESPFRRSGAIRHSGPGTRAGVPRPCRGKSIRCRQLAKWEYHDTNLP